MHFSPVAETLLGDLGLREDLCQCRYDLGRDHGGQVARGGGVRIEDLEE